MAKTFLLLLSLCHFANVVKGVTIDAPHKGTAHIPNVLKEHIAYLIAQEIEGAYVGSKALPFLDAVKEGIADTVHELAHKRELESIMPNTSALTNLSDVAEAQSEGIVKVIANAITRDDVKGYISTCVRKLLLEHQFHLDGVGFRKDVDSMTASSALVVRKELIHGHATQQKISELLNIPPTVTTTTTMTTTPYSRFNDYLAKAIKIGMAVKILPVIKAVKAQLPEKAEVETPEPVIERKKQLRSEKPVQVVEKEETVSSTNSHDVLKTINAVKGRSSQKAGGEMPEPVVEKEEMVSRKNSHEEFDVLQAVTDLLSQKAGGEMPEQVVEKEDVSRKSSHEEFDVMKAINAAKDLFSSKSDTSNN